MTVYFVDPSTVCFDGRTSSQFKEEGTGNALYLVSGPDAVQTNIKMPVTEEEIKDEVKRLKIWAKVLNLGTKFNYLIFIDIVDCAITSLSHRRCHPTSNSAIYKTRKKSIWDHTLENIERFSTNFQSH